VPFVGTFISSNVCRGRYKSSSPTFPPTPGPKNDSVRNENPAVGPILPILLRRPIKWRSAGLDDDNYTPGPSCLRENGGDPVRNYRRPVWNGSARNIRYDRITHERWAEINGRNSRPRLRRYGETPLGKEKITETVGPPITENYSYPPPGVMGSERKFPTFSRNGPTSKITRI